MNEKSAAPHLEAQPRPAVRHAVQEGRSGAERFAVVGLFTLAVFYTLYLARDLLLPICLAILLSLLLRPVIKGMKRLHVPEWLGAAFVVAGLFGATAVLIYSLSEPATTWIQRGPLLMRQLEFKLGDIRESIEAARSASREIEQITTQPAPGTAQVVVQEASLAERLLTQTQVVFAGFLIMLVLLYFFLAQSRRMLESLIGTMSRIEDRMHYATIANTVQRNIASYLATVTLINATLGAITAVVMFVLGVPNPVLWGVVGGTLNFIPYLGSAVTLAILTVVSILSFDDFWRIALPPIAWLCLTTIEGNFVTPTIVGRRLTLNPIAVFIAILFWGWLWGVPGALLAVPILAVFKIICDAHKPLHGLGALLGG